MDSGQDWRINFGTKYPQIDTGEDEIRLLRLTPENEIWLEVYNIHEAPEYSALSMLGVKFQMRKV